MLLMINDVHHRPLKSRQLRRERSPESLSPEHADEPVPDTDRTTTPAAEKPLMISESIGFWNAAFGRPRLVTCERARSPLEPNQTSAALAGIVT
jgi:hypothetical protein